MSWDMVTLEQKQIPWYKIQGSRLAFYANEKENYPEANSLRVSDKKATLITNKLARHFKVGRIATRFWGNGGGRAYLHSYQIKLPHNPSLLLIAHEFAHIWAEKKYQRSRHNYKLMRLIHRTIRYMKKKNYWQ